MEARKKVKSAVGATSQANKLIQEEAQNLLELLGVKGSVEVAQDTENELFNVQVETDQAAILIGHRGETLGAFQLILRQIVYTAIQTGIQIVVNIGDWRAKREGTLRALANNAASRAKATGELQHLYDLSPSERRFVHVELSEDPEILTESEGEGRDRHLVVKPR